MPERHLPQRQPSNAALSVREKQTLLAAFRALEGAAHTFVAEIARQARHARGRVDDDVYGIIRVTMDALQETGGVPPPLIFAVTHYETGAVEQVGFLPPGAVRLLPGGRFVTNDPRFLASRSLPPNAPLQIEG